VLFYRSFLGEDECARRNRRARESECSRIFPELTFPFSSPGGRVDEQAGGSEVSRVTDERVFGGWMKLDPPREILSPHPPSHVIGEGSIVLNCSEVLWFILNE